LKTDYDSPLLDHITNHREKVYAAMILALDRGVGQVMDAVRAIGEEDNTLIIFTSDNGGAEYIGLEDVNAPYRGFKCSLFEGGIRVPLFMKWPGQIPKGVTISDPVAHIDIFATIVAAAKVDSGVTNLLKLDGRDVMPLVTAASNNMPVENPLHPYIFWRSGHYRAIRVGAMKLQYSENPRKVWLFNLESDPTERINLAANISMDTALSCFFVSKTAAVEGEGEGEGEGEVDPMKTLCPMMQAMFKVDGEQRESLWPSMAEGVAPIDHTCHSDNSPNPCLTFNDEYVYWPN
jgi:arylsulfatase A-like enzyme